MASPWKEIGEAAVTQANQYLKQINTVDVNGGEMCARDCGLGLVLLQIRSESGASS